MSVAETQHIADPAMKAIIVKRLVDMYPGCLLKEWDLWTMKFQTSGVNSF